MFKKSLSLIFILFPFIFFSCSDVQGTLQPYMEEVTLRSQILENHENILWSDEIDPYILYEPQEIDDEQDNSIIQNLNPEIQEMLNKVKELEAAKAQKKEEEADSQNNDLKSSKKTENLYVFTHESYELLFPSIIGFGSLDTRAIDDSVRKTLNAFLQSIKNGKIATQYFAEGRLYIGAVLEYQLLSYPSPTSWIFGKPSIQEDETNSFIEVPVRMYAENSYYDLFIYFSSTNAQNYIDQIHLGSIVFE